jgi:catechol 2,3-dioxygenase-like lactoylglutathione lyase family enzyme
MITGVHAVVFAQDATRARTFFQQTLGLESVDAGGGWLIFALPPAELAAHPTDDDPRHELYLMCDDIHATVAELRAKGIVVSDEIAQERWGLTTTFELPGAGRMAIYEPRHARPTAQSDVPTDAPA